MNKFKVGDKVRIKSVDEIRKIDKSLFGITEETLKKMQGKVYTIYYIFNEDNVLELREDKNHYYFKSDFMEKVNKFYKTLPNDFTGKLTIEKGQVVEKEEKGNILDEVEKEYLRAVIKPFRKRIKKIVKYFAHFDRGHYDFIDIYLISGEEITFPYFEQNTMYKGMISGKEYTLEELGL